MSFAHFILRAGASATPLFVPAGPGEARRPDIERLVVQLEDDTRFTMNVIAREADQARARIDEGVAQAANIQVASEQLDAVTGGARDVSGALTRTCERLGRSAQATLSQVDGVEAFHREAALLAAQIQRRASSVKECADRVDVVAGLIAMLAQHAKILALNAGIEAARAGFDGRGFSAVANEINALAAKAQTAAGDVVRHLADLHAAGEANSGAARQVAELVERMGPSARDMRSAVEAQLADAADAAATAQESASFIDTVVTKAGQMKALAGVLRAASAAAKQAGEAVTLAMARYSQRSTVYIRNSVSGDRRGPRRMPLRAPGALIRGARRSDIVALDIGPNGALVMAAGLTASEERLVLSLDSIGECVGQVVSTSELGAHFRFIRPSLAMQARIAELWRTVAAEDAPLAASAREGAGLVAQALAEGVESGETTLRALMTADYRPIAGTDPVQYDTDALPFYERVLPKILRPFWARSPEPVFAFATDRNAYLPVHHEKYSAAQRPGDWAWNDLNARNRRIMERWQSLVVSRNREPEFVKVFLRHMDSGAMSPVKAFCSPIFVAGELWGNFVMGQHY